MLSTHREEHTSETQKVPAVALILSILHSPCAYYYQGFKEDTSLILHTTET